MSTDTAHGRWFTLDSERQSHLERCRECAALTIPSVLPPEGTDLNTELATPYQSHGARCVNHLSSKLWMTLFPPNVPFFRMSLSRKAQRDITEATEGKALNSEIQAALVEMEQEILELFQTQRMRTPLFHGLRHFVVTGNALFYRPGTGKTNFHKWNHTGDGLKTFTLDQYVVRRDGLGNLIELIIKEGIHYNALPPELQEQVVSHNSSNDAGDDDDEIHDLFTWARLNKDGQYEVRQELGSAGVPVGEPAIFPKDRFPWVVVRATNEQYGRGMVEDYLGDFQSLEELSQALVEAAAGAAKVVFMVDPNSSTKAEDLRDTRNLGFVPGRREDVTTLQIDKFADFRVPMEMYSDLKQQLAYAFLLHTAIQRQAERVTAEEIRYMAQELEDSLGGLYSTLAEDLQLPIVHLTIQSSSSIPKLKDLYPVVTAGLEALGRTHAQARLREFLGDVGQTLGPQAVQEYINAAEYIRRSAGNYGVDATDLIRSEEEVQQQRQQAQLMEMAQSAAAPVAGAIATKAAGGGGGGNG